MFLTGTEQIPSQGFMKKIDVYFDSTLSLPTVSTCGLLLTIPTSDVENSLKIAVLFGGGFGSI